MAGRGEAAGVRRQARAGRYSGGTAADHELVVVAAVIAAGSEKAAAHRLGLSHSTVKHHLANARAKVGAARRAQLVWILAGRLPEPEGTGPAESLAFRSDADQRPWRGTRPGCSAFGHPQPADEESCSHQHAPQERARD